MDFKDIFMDFLSSATIGIFGGLVVWWFFAGIHMFDKGLKFNNEDMMERYLWKYSFIFCALFLVIFIISAFSFMVSLTSPDKFIIISIILVMISLIWITFTFLKKLS